jgi:hypothetical protein
VRQSDNLTALYKSGCEQHAFSVARKALVPSTAITRPKPVGSFQSIFSLKKTRIVAVKRCINLRAILSLNAATAMSAVSLADVAVNFQTQAKAAKQMISLLTVVMATGAASPVFP